MPNQHWQPSQSLMQYSQDHPDYEFMAANERYEAEAETELDMLLLDEVLLVRPEEYDNYGFTEQEKLEYWGDTKERIERLDLWLKQGRPGAISKEMRVYP